MFKLEIYLYVQFSTNKICKACYYRNTYTWTCALKTNIKDTTWWYSKSDNCLDNVRYQTF